MAGIIGSLYELANNFLLVSIPLFEHLEIMRGTTLHLLAICRSIHATSTCLPRSQAIIPLAEKMV